MNAADRPRVVLVSKLADTIEMARALAPDTLDLCIVPPGSDAFRAELPGAQYLVGFVASSLNDEVYQTASQLKLVQLLSAGYETLDIDAARRSGIPVANNGGANARATAEHTLMLMLAASRHLVWQHNNVVAGRWQGSNAARRTELGGKRLGIIGYNVIGRKVAHLAQGFGMDVVYYDISRLDPQEEATLGVQFRLLGELLQSSDVISLHVPLNQATRGLIGRRALARMKSNAILINTSRGPVVDEAALVEALSSGTIASAGLDVLEQEPPSPDNPLLTLPNVVLTPHLAGPTWESKTEMMRNAFDNIERVERGQPPLWVVPELRNSTA